LKSKNFTATLYLHSIKQLQWTTQTFVGQHYHPLYTLGALRAQERWSEISGANRTHFCGAYWRYGFREDGVNSALRVARALGVQV